MTIEDGGKRAEAVPAPPRLVGQGDLLAAVESRLAANRSALLTGPSGIGKTALLDTLESTAAARGELVLRAIGSETERWISCSTLGDLIGQIPTDVRGELPEPQRSAVERILRGERHVDTDSRLRLLCRMAWKALLESCAQRHPVLVLVDDAQWVDSASLEIIKHTELLHRHHAFRTVMAGNCTGRPEGACPWLPGHAAVEYAVPPLAPDEVAELLDLYGLTARAASKLYAESRGNPYLALVLGGAFTDRSARTGGRPAPLSRRLHGLIGERLAMIPAEARETLLVAALADRPTVELLLRAGRAEAERHVWLAANAGLLVVEDDGIRFTPSAVGTVVAEAAGAVYRSTVHTELSAVVTDTAERARHRALSTDDPNADMAHSLVSAAEAARRRGARGLAANLYLLAADRTTAELCHRRIEWLVAAAEVGSTAMCTELVHRAVNAVLAADANRSQRVRARIALLDLAGQALAEMDEVFAAALQDAGQDRELLAPLRLRLSWAAQVEGRPERSEAEADLAAELARVSGDRGTEAMALAAKAIDARLTGRSDHPAIIRRALALDRQPLPGRMHLTPRFIDTRFAVFDDELQDTRDKLLRMLAAVERGGGEEIVHVLRGLSEVSARSGRCRDALDYADRALRIGEEAGLSPGPGWYDTGVAELAGGSLEHAAGYARSGMRACEQERDSVFLSRHLHVLGQALLRTGDTRQGVETLRRIPELERARGVNAPSVNRWHSDLAAGLVTLGRHDEAARLIDSARRSLGEAAPGPAVPARLDRSEAALRAATGDSDAALELAIRAASSFEKLGEPIERGHCLLVRGHIERRRRRYAAARAVTQEALDLFTRCEATPWAEQARRILAHGSGSIAARTTGGDPEAVQPLAGLTGAEGRIAVMVGEGASNREVAARMFLSVKTVEATLTRVYRKLGIRSRTQLGPRLRSS